MGRRVELSRRQFLRLSTFTATSATLAACSGLDILPHVQTVTTIGELEQSGFHFVARGTSYPWMNPLQIPSRRQERHTKQKIQTMAINTISAPVFGPMLDWAFCQCGLQESAPLTSDNARVVELTQREMILFNVLVALEWTPDEAYLGQLQSAFAQASDLLYDVTDGYMTFGQVVVGGPELMGVADFQIFASNRLFPRSTVNGLTVPRKYQPIRLGRGLWNKHQRETIQWDQSDDTRSEFGPQTLVHEWGHYALGMKDQYLRLEEQRFVVPTLSHVAHTIMADLRTSELSTRGENDDNEWQLLSLHPEYKTLSITASHQPREAAEPLVPMPAFYITGTADGAQQSLRLGRQNAAFTTYAMNPEHCWVYIVKGSSITNPTALIAQGTYEDLADGFPLLGADQGDYVVLIGNEGEGATFKSLILWAKVTGDGEPWSWQSATPVELPLVDVAVTAMDQHVPPHYTIRLDGFDSQWTAWTFPLGQHGGENSLRIENLSVLDGHVMLISNVGQLTIASYSIGGSPGNSGDPGHTNPLPAGSAEGNAMLFFYDSTRNPLKYGPLYPPNSANPLSLYYEQFKIVTITNTINLAPPSSKSWSPCSYAFSVTSNIPFTKLDPGQEITDGVYTIDLHPTLVLYYDDHTSMDGDVELTISRYDRSSKEWEIPDTRKTDTINNKPDRNLIALSLNKETAPGLYAESPEPEHYRLFKKLSL
jgi:hypothetical protein